jgi:hypothetical protein
MTIAVREAVEAELLRAILDELRGLRADLRRTRQRPHRASLLSVVAVAVTDRAFNAHELLLHAERDPALRLALDAAQIGSPKQLGHVLRTLERHPSEGWCLRRIGLDRDGIIWRVFRQAAPESAEALP